MRPDGKTFTKTDNTLCYYCTLLYPDYGFQRKFSCAEYSAKNGNRNFIPYRHNAPEVKFNLRSTGTKKFILILDEKSTQMTNVKVFDILGNLILEDKISPDDGTRKNYDLSSVNSQLFVVEVGNAKYNKTKSVYANPQGQPTGSN